MKKLLIAISLIFAGLTATADTYSGSILYGYSTTPASALEFTSPTPAGMAFQFTESDIKYFEGCKITAIAVANGAPAAGSAATDYPITLFTASGFTGVGTVETTLTYEGSMDLTAPKLYKEYPLPEPIEITADMEPLWFGMMANCDPAVANVLMFDSWAHSATQPGGMVGAADSEDDPMIWTNQSQMFGFGCLRVKIEGEKFPANEASMLDCMIPDFVETASAQPVTFYVRNEAGNDINSLTVSYKVGADAEPQTKVYTLEHPLIYNDYIELTLDMPIPAEAQNNLLLSLDITEINGVANTAAASARTASGYCLAMAPGTGFPRNMVAEIATGTWCGYCPMGIVGVSQMLAAHPDGTFIPIAVHIDDRMSTASYNLFQTNFVGSNAPVLIVNRNMERYGKRNPTFEIMSQMYPAVRATPAMASLSIDGIEIDAAGKKINVNASAEFAIGFESGDYGLVYVLTEDNVGPYYQNNYYGQPGAPEMGEWNTLPEAVEILFNGVARQINLFNGVAGSVPASVSAGETISHTAALRTNTVENIDNCAITVLLINRTTGHIENATTATVRALPIAEVAADRPEADGPIYDLMGRRIAKPAPGSIYIQGNKIYHQ